MIEETTRNVQLTMAAQSLQGRLTAMERSANALRELLKQKFGDQGVVHMMEALENLGAGSNALLEVPVSTSVNVASDLPMSGQQSPSNESKRPERAFPAAGGPISSGVNPAGNSDAYNYTHGGKVSPRGYGPSSRPLAGRLNSVQAPLEDDDDDPTRKYSKAIEGALYR
jgi:hypothetical protein